MLSTILNRRKVLLAAAAVSAALAIDGCATVASWLSNPAIAAAIEDALDVAVGVVFPALGANGPAIAQEVLTALAALISLLSGPNAATTTIGTLADDAVNAINADAGLNADVKTALVNVVAFGAAGIEEGTAAISSTVSGPLVTIFTDMQNAVQIYVNNPKSAQLQVRAPNQKVMDRYHALVAKFGVRAVL